MFKKMILFSLVIFITLFAQDEKKINSRLEEVKVFTRGAMLTHSASASLEAGQYEIIMEGLSNGIDENSIQVSAKGSAIIIAVKKVYDYLALEKKTPEFVNLENKLEEVSEKIIAVQNSIEIKELEKKLILANLKVGDEKTATVAEVKQMADYMRKRIGELKSESVSADKQLKKLELEKEKIQKQIDEIKRQNKKPAENISVLIEAKKAGQVDFTINYLINDAGWNPKYDIRVADLDSQISLDYGAAIWQRSGLDWKNLGIVLSTNRPQAGDKPQLHPWYIDFIQENYGLAKSRGGQIQMAPQVSMMKKNEYVADEVVEAETMADYFETIETTLSLEFKPQIKITISGNGKQQFVNLQQYQLDGEFEYYAAPKLSRDVFLLAKIKEWNKQSLLPGSANVYFENAFVGTTYINPATTEKELELSLGRDKNILVQRKMLQDFTEDKFLSSDIEKIFGYELTIKNNRKSPVKILVEENIPISKQEDIEVKLIEKGKAIYNEKTATLTWKFDLKNNESVIEKFVYSVRYPKDRRINNL